MAQKKWLNYSDYQKALEQVLQDVPPVVIVEGEEEYLRHLAIESIYKKIISEYPDVADVQFHGPSVQAEGKFEFSDLLTELSSASLFSSEKLIVFRGAQRTLFVAGNSEASSKKIPPVQSLAEYIKNPSLKNFLIIEVEKINKQRIIGKTMAKQVIIPCPVLGRQSDVIAWMKSVARGKNKELASDAASTLHRAHGSDLGVLASEIEKLVLYIGSEHIINEEDARQFLSGSVEFSIFELTNSLERRDLAGALHFSRLICEQGSRDQSGKKQDGQSSAHQAMALISSLLENMIHVRAMIAEQLSPSEIVAEMGMHPKRAENIIRTAGNFTIEELQHALSVMASEMHSTHDTGADTKLSLERVIVAVCQKKKHYSV